MYAVTAVIVFVVSSCVASCVRCGELDMGGLVVSTILEKGRMLARLGLGSFMSGACYVLMLQLYAEHSSYLVAPKLL